MSFEIGVWYADPPITAEEALRRYLAWCDAVPEATEPSAPVTAFYADLTRELPDLTAENYAASPWATPLTVGDDFVLMDAVFPRAAEACRVVLRLAGEHRMVCFDPQTDHDTLEMTDSVRFGPGDASLVLRPTLEDVLRGLAHPDPPPPSDGSR
ncbi:hypothetical protein Sru01_06980 [Sphaerisporangium rufum]|uniref:Uncharacterized protein n=1 Tax=Sphaerisporangium rufum TaxID=1381558 RepID=A0A919UW62_9ACTN|nr:hypothetical protein [Sphaerisporangium rufum]GII75716.1 hypothetical protein Sru01_06980 [Sphaerisporangium rufum]